MTYGRFTMTVEEIADYLKLLGFKLEYYSNGDDVLISVSWEYSSATVRLWNDNPTVGLYIYGDGAVLLNALSKSYMVTPSMGISGYFYDIMDSNNKRNSNNRRNNRLS